MATKQVTQHNCDRCKRVWYEDVGGKESKTLVSIESEIDGEQLLVKQECLCAGCRATVKGLLAQIAKTMEKASPIRVAKKKEKKAAAEVVPPPAASSPSTKPSLPSVVVAPAVSTPLSVPAAKSGVAATHPTR